MRIWDWSSDGCSSDLIDQAPMAAGVRGNLWVRFKGMSRDRARWREFCYLMLRFPAGIATFTLAVTALTAPVIVAYAPVSARFVDESDDAKSDHRRVGHTCLRTVRSRWSPYI